MSIPSLICFLYTYWKMFILFWWRSGPKGLFILAQTSFCFDHNTIIAHPYIGIGESVNKNLMKIWRTTSLRPIWIFVHLLEVWNSPEVQECVHPLTELLKFLYFPDSSPRRSPACSRTSLTRIDFLASISSSTHSYSNRNFLFGLFFPHQTFSTNHGSFSEGSQCSCR